MDDWFSIIAAGRELSPAAFQELTDAGGRLPPDKAGVKPPLVLVGHSYGGYALRQGRTKCETL